MVPKTSIPFSRRHANFEPQLAEHEFNAWRGSPLVMGYSHIHTDLEINYILRGGITYFAAGRLHNLSAGETAVFWAGMPHELVAVEADTEMVWVVIPLAWFIQWQLPVALEQSLLRGAFVHNAQVEGAAANDFTFRRWANDMESASAETKPEITKLTLLEVEAYLRRLALCKRALHRAGEHETAINEIGASQIEKMARFMSAHYREEIDINSIAAAVNLHPNYAMQLFKEQSGITLWEYLTRLRISHAQRLLLTTDAKIERVAYESGFGSMARFYSVFKKYCGATPRSWRVAHERSS